jgi:hypothetical protein
MPPPLNLTGQRFGSLVALARAGQDNFGAWIWACQCDCGRVVQVRGSTLRAGRTSACASCATSRANRTHGQSKTPLYRRWQGMKARCTQPNHKHYPNYGGRGIQVCERWLNSFEAFAADMGPTFSEDLELDRIDVDGHYEPSNCRWVDREAQQRNRRNNSRITYRGETRTVIEWAELMGVKPNTLTTRIRRGWPAERVLLELANGGAS